MAKINTKTVGLILIFIALWMNQSKADSCPRQVLSQKLNEILRIPLFPTNGTIIWNIPVRDIGNRLEIPVESSTSYETSFRSYLTAPTNSILKSPFYLYGTPTNTCGFTSGINCDYSRLQRSFDLLLGPSPGMIIRASAFNQTESFHYWEWPDQQCCILVTSINAQTSSLRILPKSSLDYREFCMQACKTAKIKSSERIRRDSSNGDVILEIPMVDCGPSESYKESALCRILKFYGQEADLEFLKHCWPHDPEDVVVSILSNTGTRWNIKAAGITVNSVKHCIDSGKPLFVPIYATEQIDRRVSERMRNRKGVFDWVKWKGEFLKKNLDSVAVNDWKKWKSDIDALRSFQSKGTMYQRYANIIGYNEQTREIAYTIPSTNSYPVIWLTEEEMRVISSELASY